MSGFITTATVKAERATIVELFGEAFFDFCLTREGSTFLDTLREFEALKPAA